MWMSYSPDLKNWGGHTLMMEARKGAWWDANKIGLFSPDGHTLASGSWDNIIRLWNVSDGSLLRTFESDEIGGWAMTFSPAGRLLAATSSSHTVCLWRVNDGTLLKTLGPNQYYRKLAFSPDGQILAAGSLDGIIHLWRVSDGNLLQTLKITGYVWNTIWDINFSPDGKILASGTEDALIRLWDVSNGQLLNTVRGHSSSIIALAYCDEICVEIANALGYEVVHFNVLGDAGATYSKNQVKAALLHAPPSSIILMHMNHPESKTAEGVIEVIPELKKRGLRFVRLKEFGLK